MSVKIKPRHDILEDIIHEAKDHPTGWNAAFGKDSSVFSHDCYIFHPHIGIYLLKEFHKNPYEVKGIGLKLARHIDDDIQEQITKKSGDFGIIRGDIRKIIANINKGIPPQQILSSAMRGEDLGITIPVQGHASTAQDTFYHLKHMFSHQQKKLGASFEKMVSDDGFYTSYE